jgi:hypothetical protein
MFTEIIRITAGIACMGTIGQSISPINVIMISGEYIAIRSLLREIKAPGAKAAYGFLILKLKRGLFLLNVHINRP